MNNTFKDIVGYLLGLCIFVLGIPALMLWLSGIASIFPPGDVYHIPSDVSYYYLRSLSGQIGILGLALSIWSIIYMRKVGKGNPFDAYGHEVAPRTKELMTQGPYRICRNPMLLGIYIYHAGWVSFIWSWIAGAIFLVEVILLTLQVRSEEKRLEKDFGEAYLNYKKRTGRYLPFPLCSK